MNFSNMKLDTNLISAFIQVSAIGAVVSRIGIFWRAEQSLWSRLQGYPS